MHLPKLCRNKFTIDLFMQVLYLCKGKGCCVKIHFCCFRVCLCCVKLKVYLLLCKSVFLLCYRVYFCCYRVYFYCYRVYFYCVIECIFAVLEYIFAAFQMKTTTTNGRPWHSLKGPRKQPPWRGKTQTHSNFPM